MGKLSTLGKLAVAAGAGYELSDTISQRQPPQVVYVTVQPMNIPTESEAKPENFNNIIITIGLIILLIVIILLFRSYMKRNKHVGVQNRIEI